MEIEKNFSVEDKKRFLNRFYWLTKEQEKIEENLNQIILKINGIKATTFSYMPKGGPHQDIISLLNIKEKYQSQLIRKMEKIENVKLEIESSIDTIEDSRLRLILRYKYLECYTYKEIAVEFKKSERHVRRLHDIAIRLIKIIKI